MPRWILTLTLAFILATYLGPLLAPYFVATGAGAVNAPFVLLPNFGDMDQAQIIQITVATLGLWLLLTILPIPFGFIRPRAARYSDTKPMRYLQG